MEYYKRQGQLRGFCTGPIDPRVALDYRWADGALRKERQTVFNSLLQQGLKPRWRKGVEIEFFSAGGWIQHDFEYFGG